MQTDTPTWAPSHSHFAPKQQRTPRPLMGSIMRSAVNHSSISRDRLSLPETIYWIPRSKRPSSFSALFLGSYSEGVCVPSVPAGRPLFPSFTHEDSFLSLPTSSVLGFPSICQNFSPHWFSGYTKPTSCFQLLNQGGSREFYLQILGGGRAGRGGGERGGTYLKKLNSGKEIKKRG